MGGGQEGKGKQGMCTEIVRSRAMGRVVSRTIGRRNCNTGGEGRKRRK